MISADEARSFVLSELRPLSPVDVPLAASMGLVATGTIAASEPAPSFTNSAMDGFAVRARDVTSSETRLRIVDSVFAGESSDVVVGEGEATRIMTGAPLPPGADSVCPREEATVEPDGEHVVIHRTMAVGDSVRHVGDDMTVGQVLVVPGDVISPALLGALAAQGVASISVHPRPEWACCQLATSSSTPRGPSGLARSVTPTARRCSPRSRARGSPRSTWERCATRRRNCAPPSNARAESATP